MREIFLGKAWHWGLLVVVGALFWFAGRSKFHVTYFNGFLIALGIGTLAVVVLLLTTTRQEEQVTRDPLDIDDPD